jgi:PAS domain-containing protein
MSKMTGGQKWPELPPAFQQTVANGQLFDVLPVAIYCCDRDGLLLQFNRKAAELWGRAPCLGDTDERFCGSHRLFWPDGTLLPHADTRWRRCCGRACRRAADRSSSSGPTARG